MEKVKVERRMPVDRRLPKELYDEARQGIGSYYDKDSKQSALAFRPGSKEEKAVMPLIIDIPYEEKEFRKEVKKFCINYKLDVPSDGVDLNITWNEGDDSPVSPVDYFAYHFIKKHPDVYTYEEKDLALNRPVSDNVFIVTDPRIEKAKKVEQGKLRSKAMAAFLKAQKSSSTVDYVLELTKNIHQSIVKELDSEEKELAFADIFEKDPGLFLDLVNDSKLEQRALLSKLIASNVLQKQGNSIWEENEKLADSEESMIFWLADAGNKEHIIKLKDRLVREDK